jgi:hypothetical protein
MNHPRVNQNPFDLTKASDFTDDQIIQYWVDLVGDGGLYHLFKPTQHMPMLLMGGKGSGKTHLMRYYSSTVQKLRCGNLIKAIQDEKMLGIYVRADALNVGRFDGKGYGEDEWGAVFNFYFELWLATHFLKNLQECQRENQELINEHAYIAAAKGLFSSNQPATITSLQLLIDHLAELRKRIDLIVSNCATKRTSLKEIEICVNPGELVFELPSLVKSHSHAFNDVTFVYMIDEIENFNAVQQKFLNTLIRYRRGPTSIKVGARLYGIRTKETIGVGEVIKQDSEYEKVELDAFLRENSSKYAGFAKQLILKRLQESQLAPPGEISSHKLEDYFQTLDSNDHYREEGLRLVSNFDNNGKERPYFAELRSRILEVTGADKDATSREMVDAIIESLRVKDYPLLEKANLHIFYRDWGNISDLYTLAKKIGIDANNFLKDGKTAAPNYFQIFDHFKSDFLAQLYRACGKGRGVYAGLDTLIDLSQGIPRNLLSLLKHIYRRSFFAGEQPFQSGKVISIDSQVEGVRDASAWFWDDSQPDSHGPEVRAAVESLAELFREVRYSPKPSECDLCTFRVDTGTGTQAARNVLKHAENWSYLVRIRDGAINSNNSAAIDEKFQLSPMLAPRWGVSEHRRGALQLNPSLFNALFDPEHKAELSDLVRERLQGMKEPQLKLQKTTLQQNTLF